MSNIANSKAFLNSKSIANKFYGRFLSLGMLWNINGNLSNLIG